MSYLCVNRKSRRLDLVVVICTILVALCLPNLASADLELNVTRVGFPTLQRGDVVRGGSWAPVIVDISLIDQHAFDGVLRVSQFDDDGDECYDAVEVHLLQGSAESQRYYLYALPNPLRNRGRFIVELFDGEGEAVPVVSQGELTYRAQPAQPSVILPDDSILILSLSSGTLGRVQDLVGADQQDVYHRPVSIGHMDPADLPELWIGLEAVDYIVWDHANPEQLTERQVEALLTWVRRGGTLLLAASREAGSLRLTNAMNKVLPCEIGELSLVNDLPEVRRSLLGVDETDETGFPEPIPMVECSPRKDAKRVPDLQRNTSNLITRRREGQGHVIFCGVALDDLFSGVGRPTEFFQKVFHLNLLGEADPVRPNPVSLFEDVVSAIGFATSAGVYLVVAGVFSVGYVFMATLGSWGVLSARRWRHHSWTVFACTAVVASLLSVVAVNTVRGGFGESLYQISVIDFDAGKAYGFATTFFGLKTGTDKVLDLWIPDDTVSAGKPGRTNCVLRPIPSGNIAGSMSSSFADPGSYRLVPGSAAIENVRIRATLKRFEGRWEGLLGGTVTGDIGVRGRDRIMEGSYLVNDLGVDLHDCYLFHTTTELALSPGFRSRLIYALPIGALPADGQRVDLPERCYKLAEGETFREFLERCELASAQTRWGSKFRTVLGNLGYGSVSGAGLALGQERNALMLVSTIGEFDASEDAGMTAHFMGLNTWSRDRLRQLDLREQLTPDSMILIGFADDPGPVRLFRRTKDAPYRMIEPDPERCWTMYRVRIPVTVFARAAKEEDDDSRVR